MVGINKGQQGFSLIELLIVVVIIAILAALGTPAYQNYMKRGKRADTMSSMQNMASDIQALKLTKGSYNAITADDLTVVTNKYSQVSNGQALYTININLDGNADGTRGDWIITAAPVFTDSNPMKNDGVITLSADGKKCRNGQCGQGNEWS